MTKTKEKLLRFGCLLLATLTLSASFVGCNKKDDEKSTKEKSTITTTEAAQDPVPHYDWQERTFTVLSVGNAHEPNFEVVGEMNGETMPKTVFNRNSWIEEYYNVSIGQVVAEDKKALEILEELKMAGEYDYDLTFLVRNDMSTAIMKGYMVDLNKVSYLDFTKDWYNGNTIDSMKIGGRLFHMVSDFSLVDKARTNVLFLNRDMVVNNNLPDIIQQVRDGEWTIEQMLTYTQTISSDLDGEGMALEDQWGLVCGGKEGAVAFWNGLGNEMVAVNEDSTWSVNVANEHSVNSIAKLKTLFAEDVSFVGDRFGDYADSSDVFVAGRALFLGGVLSTIESLGSKATFAYTALPFPKYDSTQASYYTTNDNTYCATFGIPTCAADADFSGFMIEVLSWQSSTTTFPTYYETVCKLMKSYDSVCAEMLDLVFDGLVFDFGLMYSNYINLKTNILQKSIYSTEDITGLYDGVKTSTESKIQNLFTAVEILD